MVEGIKAIKQAGIFNFLGKQKMVTVPIRWKSGEDHPETELAYITQPEKELLIKLDLHGSMKDGKPNKGPGGIISLNSGGSGDGGSGGDGGDGGDGDSGGSVGSDTGDMGSESANNAATDAANASVGIGDVGPTDPGIATDTISSFGNNLAANVMANPVMAAISPMGTMFSTAMQTAQARSMMGLANPSLSPSSSGEGDDERRPYQAITPATTSSSSLGTAPKKDFFNLGIVPLLLTP